MNGRRGAASKKKTFREREGIRSLEQKQRVGPSRPYNKRGHQPKPQTVRQSEPSVLLEQSEPSVLLEQPEYLELLEQPECVEFLEQPESLILLEQVEQPETATHSSA